MDKCEAADRAESWSLTFNNVNYYYGPDAYTTCQTAATALGTWPLRNDDTTGLCILPDLVDAADRTAIVRQWCDPEPGEPQPPASAPVIACTLEKPCHVEMAPQQMDAFMSWLGVFFVVALFVAFAHGYGVGEART